MATNLKIIVINHDLEKALKVYKKTRHQIHWTVNCKKHFLTKKEYRILKKQYAIKKNKKNKYNNYQRLKRKQQYINHDVFTKQTQHELEKQSN